MFICHPELDSGSRPKALRLDSRFRGNDNGGRTAFAGMTAGRSAQNDKYFMIDLKPTSGLPVELTDDGKLQFNQPLKQIEPIVRKFQDMIPVLLDKSAKPNPQLEEVYYMYRDVHMQEHEPAMREKHLRYDITVIPSMMLGKEFNKTVGHYHPLAPGKNLAYPELYEVLEGEALFLIQKVDETGKNIEDIQAIKAEAGDKIIYPPGYGHIIVNIGGGPLVTSNWVADNFESLYQPIKEKAGMGYYVVSNGQDGFDFVVNPNYGFVPPIKFSKTPQSGFGLDKQEPMYLTGIKDLDKLKFLTDPEILTAN